MNVFLSISLLCSLLYSTSVCNATVASPHGFHEKQPDGSLTSKLYIHGDAGFHYVTDDMGYVVMQDEKKRYVYAQENSTAWNSFHRRLVPSSNPVGRQHQRRAGQVHKDQYLRYIVQHQPYSHHRVLQAEGIVASGRVPITHGILNNLVVLLCFADHENRNLPPISDIDILYNELGGNSRVAPSGSVRDVFLQSSYGKLDVVSYIYDWIVLPYNESYYADGKTGDSDKFLDAIHYSLSIIDTDDNFSFRDFDKNEDGFIDAISFLHTGYGAEWGGVDCYGTNFYNRIWSHQLDLAPRFYWIGKDMITLDSYHISSVFFGSCGEAIARIGTLSHELGHFLSLGDLYDRKGHGLGVGSYCLMGDSWGFDGSQFYPGVMSVWSKMELGWVKPIDIISDGRYELNMSQTSDIAYRINHGFPEGEYLLLENRQSQGFDQYLDHGGIAIWHIDLKGDQSQTGHPGQSGWPENGNHYKVALVQADGKFELERGFQFRGKGDLFHKDIIYSIGPSIDTSYGPFPNTDSYQNGVIRKTGITIFDISESSHTMSFQVAFTSIIDIDEKVKDLEKLETTYNTNSGTAGNMFSIVAKRDIIIYGFHIHMLPLLKSPLHILMKNESYQGFEHDAESWHQLMNINITGNGISNPTKILLLKNNEIHVPRNQKLSFYITLESDAMRYTVGNAEGQVFSANDDLSILEGIGIKFPFGKVYSPRVWNGGILYDYGFKPSASPHDFTSEPSILPSLQPTSQTENSPSPSPIHYKTLMTTFVGGSGSSGNMFSILTSKCISITGLTIHVSSKDPLVEVWVKGGSYEGHESERSSWRLHFTGVVIGEGELHIPESAFLPLNIRDPGYFSFYITLQADTGMKYTVGIRESNVVSKNEDISILEGIGVRYPFGQSFSPRTWNGSLTYKLTWCNSSPDTLSPRDSCPKSKRWSDWKQKCVPRCRRRNGKKYSSILNKCVEIK